MQLRREIDDESMSDVEAAEKQEEVTAVSDEKEIFLEPTNESFHLRNALDIQDERIIKEMEEKFHPKDAHYPYYRIDFDMRTMELLTF